MRRQPDTEQERPSSTADVRQSGIDKPMVKRSRVERESEGLIVPLTVSTKTASEGRGSASTVSSDGGKREGMTGFVRSNNPIEKCDNSNGDFSRPPKAHQGGVSMHCMTGSGGVTCCWKHGNEFGQTVVLLASMG